ncbi:hypothetical protein QBC47DRAFT_365879 [Echria macrotheca]|uniref:Uncharacterized protein n=1 Tax=Echria macrotheca TaxID=438768 RepID=A0AAJ0B1A6_9PEZI|nr:hypothetical protein QBC47DRAFT_365879 [Echria macrotheca]
MSLAVTDNRKAAVKVDSLPAVNNSSKTVMTMDMTLAVTDDIEKTVTVEMSLSVTESSKAVVAVAMTPAVIDIPSLSGERSTWRLSRDADGEFFEHWKEREETRNLLFHLDYAIDIPTRSFRLIIPYMFDREGVTLEDMPEARIDMIRAYQSLLRWYSDMILSRSSDFSIKSGEPYAEREWHGTEQERHTARAIYSKSGQEPVCYDGPRFFGVENAFSNKSTIREALLTG